jgi:hypothetical protein
MEVPDWKRSMRRTYEYWQVDPLSWGDVTRIDEVTACTITRDLDDELLSNATVDLSMSTWEWEDEVYIRVYLVTEQDHVSERFALGTFLMLATDWSFSGMRGSSSVTGYSPLKELADDSPPLGYPIGSGNTAQRCVTLASAHCRAPVEPAASGEGIAIADPYVADDDDTWNSFLSGVLAKSGHRLDVTERGHLTIAPMRYPAAIAPAYVFDDSNSSILRPAVTVSANLPDVPNVVQLIYSRDGGSTVVTREDNDPGKPTSLKRRGRRVLYRETSPELPDNPSQADVEQAADKVMRDKGAAVYEVGYEHAFVPDVRPGTGVRLAYGRAGIDVNAMVVSQTISCTPACLVQETARFTK